MFHRKSDVVKTPLHNPAAVWVVSVYKVLSVMLPEAVIRKDDDVREVEVSVPSLKEKKYIFIYNLKNVFNPSVYVTRVRLCDARVHSCALKYQRLFMRKQMYMLNRLGERALPCGHLTWCICVEKRVRSLALNTRCSSWSRPCSAPALTDRPLVPLCFSTDDSL